MKVITCGVRAGAVTWNERVTWVAAAYVEFPGWLAARVQVPALRMVTTKPETVQTDGVLEVNATVRFESAVGAKVTVVVAVVVSAG